MNQLLNKLMNKLEGLRWRFGSNETRVKILRKRGVRISGEGGDIAPDVSFGSEPYLISLGANVRISWGVNFVTHDGGVWVVRHYQPAYYNVDVIAPIVVGNNVHIGTNCIIIPGVYIGDNVIIGCGAVVTRDIPSNSVAAGVPCKVIRSIDEYILKHKKDFLAIEKLNAAQKKEFLLKKFHLEDKK